MEWPPLPERYWIPPPEGWRVEIRVSSSGRYGDPLNAEAGFGRSAITDGRVQALPIAKHLGVSEHRCLGGRAGAEVDLVHVPLLQGGEEAFNGRIVEAVAAWAHGLADTVPV